MASRLMEVIEYDIPSSLGIRGTEPFLVDRWIGGLVNLFVNRLEKQVSKAMMIGQAQDDFADT